MADPKYFFIDFCKKGQLEKIKLFLERYPDVINEEIILEDGQKTKGVLEAIKNNKNEVLMFLLSYINIDFGVNEVYCAINVGNGCAFLQLINHPNFENNKKQFVKNVTNNIKIKEALRKLINKINKTPNIGKVGRNKFTLTHKARNTILKLLNSKPKNNTKLRF